jgi:hypothetical protein
MTAINKLDIKTIKVIKQKYSHSILSFNRTWKDNPSIKFYDIVL